MNQEIREIVLDESRDKALVLEHLRTLAQEGSPVLREVQEYILEIREEIAFTNRVDKKAWNALADEAMKAGELYLMGELRRMANETIFSSDVNRMFRERIVEHYGVALEIPIYVQKKPQDQDVEHIMGLLYGNYNV
jgi:hypothetical protein